MIALLRAPDPSIARCELTFVNRTPIDFAKLRAQHDAYADALRSCGVEVRMLPSLPDAPDGVFVEDTAVVLDDLAVISRPGADSRQAETASTEKALEGLLKIERVLAPATLEGGDVLRIGRKLYVGRSSRTNAEGILLLRKLAEPLRFQVHSVDVVGCLHLKTAVSWLGGNSLLVQPEWIDCAAFKGFSLTEVDGLEPFAANILRLPTGQLIASRESPRTLAKMRAAGFEPILISASEFLKAEAGLTCLSLILESPRNA